MPRNILRPVSLAVLAVAVTAVVTACGDDSTATSAPTSLSPTSTAASPASSTSAAAATTATDPTGTGGDPVNPGQAATAPPETPQAIPSGFPGPDAVPMGEKEQAYLDELDSEGIEVSGNGESAVAIANYVCAAQHAGEPPDAIAVNVGAMAGVEQTLTGSDTDPVKAAQVYIDVATSTYCP